MDNKRTTILTFVAVVVMFTVCFIGLAVVGDEGSDADDGTVVAKIGNDEYTSLEAAIDAVKTGETILLVGNVTATDTIQIDNDKQFTIDLNGHNITSTVASPTKSNQLEKGTYIDGGHAFLNYGTLTIKGDGTITTNTTGAAIILNLEGGTVNLEGGTYKTKDNNTWYMLANYGTMNIYSGVTVDGLNLATSGSGPSLIFTGWNDESVGEKDVKMNIYGGDFKGGLNTFKNSAWCTLTIYDGSFLNSVQSTVLNWNIMEIYGGTFQQLGTAGKPLIMVGFFHEKSCIGKTTIHDGSFYSANGQPCIGPHASSYSGYTTYIHGGTYSDLSGLPYVVDGKTYTLNSDCTISSDATVLASTTLDATGKTITIGSGVKFEMESGAIFKGTIVGPDNNSLVTTGTVAGSKGITITGGSLKIDGEFVTGTGTYSGVVVTVSGSSISISGTLASGVTMIVEEDTIVEIEEDEEFTSNGTITNNGTIANNGTVTNNGMIDNKSSIFNNSTFTNTGTLKMTDNSIVYGTKTVKNDGMVADERADGTIIVPIDTSSSTGIVVADYNIQNYVDANINVIERDPETTIKSTGTVTVDNYEYGFIDSITIGEGGLKVILKDDGRKYTITFAEGTEIPIGTYLRVTFLEGSSDSIRYKIDTDGIPVTSVKLSCPSGFGKATVNSEPSIAISGIDYDSNGYVKFNVNGACDSTFLIVLSGTPATSDDSPDMNMIYVSAFVVLVVALFSLVAVIKRR